MRVNAIECTKCGDTIYSRARHDMMSCTCGAISIDGGFDYIKVSGTEFILATLNLKGVTKERLYNDWNKNGKKYGLIRGKGIWKVLKGITKSQSKTHTADQ